MVKHISRSVNPLPLVAIGGRCGSRRSRRRRSGTSADGSSSRSSSRDGHSARLSARDKAKRLVERKPGELTEKALGKMRSYLVSKGHAVKDATEPCMVNYFTSVYLPSCQGKLHARNELEMRTLATAVDSILEADLGTATDVLIQQYKSIEQLHADGGTWKVARHASVVGDGRVSITDDREREALLRDEKRDMSYRKLEGQVGSGRGPY